MLQKIYTAAMPVHKHEHRVSFKKAYVYIHKSVLSYFYPMIYTLSSRERFPSCSLQYLLMQTDHIFLTFNLQEFYKAFYC